MTAPADTFIDPRMDQDADIRRANLAEREHINRAISDAAQLLLSLRAWASPAEARAMISAIRSVAYGHAQIMDATDAHEAVEFRERHACQRRGPFAGLRG
jgi:hypothetical protein